MFCVVCGKEAPLDELRGGECPGCYLERNVLVKVRENVDVEVCVHCHARRRGEQWMEGHGSLAPVVEDGVREAIEFAKVVDKPRVNVEVVPEDERNFTIVVEASGVAEGVPFTKELRARSRVKNGTCVRCSRVQGGYYEAIVQVRATRRGIEKEEMRALKALASRFIERVVADGDRNAFVLRDEEIDRGLDVYMGTTNSGRMLAKQIATEFGGKVSEHPKTVGQKDGLDLVRMTFAIKLPEYRSGDIVILDEEPLLVTSIGAKTVQVTKIATGQARHVERALVERAVVLSPEDAKEAVVVTSSDSELQLLDPWTYETVSVLRPAALSDVGPTVDVLKFDGELIPLPTRKKLS
ncbi:MAG TPA: NMD3-related protein [Candidatus Thermoplasmatota archaeon]|nr:NMD3-related protein [Candidatus Thermoplasmatota archaeon]